MSEQAMRGCLARRRFVTCLADPSNLEPDRPVLTRGRGRDPGTVGDPASSPYRREPQDRLFRRWSLSARGAAGGDPPSARLARQHDPADRPEAARSALVPAPEPRHHRPDPGVLRLPLAADQRHAAAQASRRGAAQPAHAGDGHRSAGSRPLAAAASAAPRWPSRVAASATIHGRVSSTSIPAIFATGSRSASDRRRVTIDRACCNEHVAAASRSRRSRPG